MVKEHIYILMVKISIYLVEIVNLKIKNSGFLKSNYLNISKILRKIKILKIV
jgi:hypothetical protein